MQDDASTERAGPKRDEPFVLRHSWLVVSVGIAAAAYVLVASSHPGAGWSVFADTDDPEALRSYGIRLATVIAGVVAGALAWGRLELSRREHHRQLATEERLSAAMRADQLDRDLDRQRADLAASEERSARQRDQHRSDLAAAVEQLGHQHRSVRLAGLLALEALAGSEHADAQRIYDIVCAFARDNLPVDVATFENVIHLSYTQNFDGEVSMQGPGELLGGFEVLHLPVDYAEAVAIALRASKGTRLNLQRTLIVDQTIRLYERPGDSLDLTDAIVMASRFDGDHTDGTTFVSLRKAAIYHCDWSLASAGGITLKDCRVFHSNVKMRGKMKSLRLHQCRILHSDVSTDDATVLSMKDCDLQATRFGEFGDGSTSNVRDCTFHRCTGSFPPGPFWDNTTRHCDFAELSGPRCP